MKTRGRLLVTTSVIPAVIVAGMAAGGIALMGGPDASAQGLGPDRNGQAALVGKARVTLNPPAVPRPHQGYRQLAAACNPCNPCAATKNPCNPCNPCAASPCGPCGPCSPCAAGGEASTECVVPRLESAAASPCGPCAPCAAESPCSPCGPCAPCAAESPCSPCNPCAATKNPCNPCNPCAATKQPCSPCAAESPCGPCGPCSPCGPAEAVELTAEEAVALYDCLINEMKDAYAKSDNEIAMTYTTWRRYNSRPYVSATHGERYVNNYAHSNGKAYGAFEEVGTMPEGAQIAKDSFSVTNDGAGAIGPLFVMEKMEAGFNPESDDWRYTMIMPDGSVFGTTKGKGAQNVQFCVGCHITAEDTDSLMFMPEDVRVK